MTILSIVNSKGGVGKTTLSAAIADALATTGRRVCAIDLDPQASLTDWSKRCAASGDPVPFDMQPFPDDDLVDVAKHLRKALRSAPSYDVTVLDGPPSNDDIQRALINASDFILIPVTPGGMAARAAKKIVEEIRAASAAGKQLKAAMVINGAQERELATRHMGAVLAQHGIPLTDARVPSLTVFKKMDMLSKPLSVIGAEARPAQDAIQALITELEI